MKGKTILYPVLLVIMLFVCTRAFAAAVVIIEVSGKVEIKVPGEPEWKPAESGMEVPLNTEISTGFRSYALLDLESSEIEVMALTRMKVSELVTSRESVSTSLLLNAGTVRADVKTSETRTHDFTITGPIATAAVRGTSFVFNGYVLTVLDGNVLYVNALGERVTVVGGTVSKTTGYTVPLPPVAVLEEETTVVTAPAGAEEEAAEEPPLQSESDSGLPPEEGLSITLEVE